jgi:hypothetical protein
VTGTGDDSQLNADAQRLEMLDHDECVSLLRHGGYLGRVAVLADDGRPVILPVNYTIDEEAVVFCTAAGTKLDAILGGADLAFEVDANRPLHHSGWSVLVRGVAEIVTDRAAVARLQAGPLRPWVKGAMTNWIRLPLDEISGRRLPEI